MGVLLAVIMTAFIFSISAFAALLMALSRASQASPLNPARVRARYAAEAGIVWGLAKLWTDPNWFATKGLGKGTKTEDFDIDTDGDGAWDTEVDVFLQTCMLAPCEPRVLRSKVEY
jgi:hypothetical protein